MKTIKTSFGILTISSVLAMLVHSQSFLTNGLVAYYPFNGNANDASGNGNNGIVNGATLTTNRFSNPNSAYYFTGNNPAVYLPSTIFNNLAEGTISAWIELDNNAQGTIFAKQHDGQNSIGIFTVGFHSSEGGLPASGQVGQLYYHPVNGRGLLASSSNLLSAGIWYQVTVAFSQTNCELYINGLLSSSFSGDFSIPNDTSAITSIGYWGGEIAIPMSGRISDFRIYNRALSSTEVAQMYAIGAALPPQITQDLTNNYVVYGQNTTLGVQVSSSSSVTYQWYWVPANNSGQAGAYAQLFGSFVVAAVVTNGGFGYGNVPNVIFVAGGGSGAAGFAAVSNGVVASITVTNAGFGYANPPSILVDPPNGLLFSQTNSTFTITHANQSNLGNYSVVVSNSSGSVTSSVVNLTLLYPPSITFNPVGFTGTYHSSNSMTVYATGTAPFIYQWALNGTNILGATNSGYNINSLTLAGTGAYTVVVSNPYGSTNSGAADVYMAPALTAPFAGTTTLWGQDATLGVGAIGSGVLSYQWYFNGAPISGANGSNYLLSGIQFTNAGLYSVVVSSAYGGVTNQAYQVVVNPAYVSIKICPDVVIQGTVGYSFIIQSTMDLSDTNSWVTETNITLSEPILNWNDNNADVFQPGNPHKFYRVLPQQ
jgi:hypothetical protein